MNRTEKILHLMQQAEDACSRQEAIKIIHEMDRLRRESTHIPKHPYTQTNQ